MNSPELGNTPATLDTPRQTAASVIRHVLNDALYRDSFPVIDRMRREGHTYEAIVTHLHTQGILPPGGGRWSPASVRRVLLRCQPEQIS